jgi:hypothetical protein
MYCVQKLDTLDERNGENRCKASRLKSLGTGLLQRRCQWPRRYTYHEAADLIIAAAENFTTPPPPKNACRRADAAAADILFGAPPKRCCHVHFSISCFTSIAVVLLIYRNKS